MELRILELFSGIGGMHYAFEYSQVNGHVVAAMDINTVANAVYAHNHKSTPVMNNNIQILNVKQIEKLNVNTILMSPPCQPHTRVGHKRDLADKRSDALTHLCEIIPQCKGLQLILMENVKGFEASQARQHFIEALQEGGFKWREFIISPTQFGVPNTRHRYYCIARKGSDFSFKGDEILTELPCNKVMQVNTSKYDIRNFLESNASNLEDLLLSDKILTKHAWLLDIVTAYATNTMCFTKAYTHYCEGTGSVFTPFDSVKVKNVFEDVKRIEQVSEGDVQDQRLELLKSLQLRYFTPYEVARLMCFPKTFEFPAETTNRQRYRLLGNSINVKVVGELIKLLCLPS